MASIYKEVIKKGGNNSMRAVIMAGGKGMRLRPYTKSYSKTSYSFK